MKAALMAPIAGLLALAAQAQTAMTVLYTCERGARVEATYLNVAEGSFAVLHAEGRQVALRAQSTGSGARYVSLDDKAP